MRSRVIGDPHVEKTRGLASRRSGTSVPEIVDFFGVSRWAVRRFVERLVRERILVVTGATRKRSEVFGRTWGGGAARVYRARVPLRVRTTRVQRAVQAIERAAFRSRSARRP